MKKTISLILSICSLAVAIAALVCVFVQPGQAEQPSSETTEQETSPATTVFFNLDQVLARYDMAIKLQADFEKKAKSVDQEITRRRTKLENEDKDLSDKLNKGLMTRSTAEVKYNELQKKVADFQQYGAQKQNELAEEQQGMLNNIANAVMEYVQKYNAVKGYDLVLATQGALLSTPVVTGDSALDITEELIKGLNEEYNSSK